jgi:hypothetical protein
MAAVLYLLTALACIALVDRLILRIGWRFALLLIVLPLVFTGRALLSGAVYAPIDLPYHSHPLRAMMDEAGVEKFQNPILSDLYAQMIPWKKAVREAYLGGEWPLWNPHQFAGDILAASSQPAPYDPLLLISLLVPLPQSLTFLASMTRRDLEISMDGEGWVIVSELGWKGWKAYNGGRELPLRTANLAFLAFHLPAGEHEVTLVYWPRSFFNGAVITFTTAGLLLLWWSVRRVREMRRRRSVPVHEP